MRARRGYHIIRDSAAYVPFSVIGIFIVLGAALTSAYFLQADYQIAQTIYNTERTDPQNTALGLAATDLSRCLNYAGMEALQWKGQHPIIEPRNTSANTFSEDDFRIIAKDHDVESGGVMRIEANLPADVWYSISSLWANKTIVITISDEAGNVIEVFDLGEAVSMWHSVSFEKQVTIPESCAYGYGLVEMHCGGELKASDWFALGMDPVKDITANSFNELIRGSYQNNTHVFGKYAINVKPDIGPGDIHISGINGTLERHEEQSGKVYQIYQVFSINDLNYTLVDLETGQEVQRSMNISTLVSSRQPLLEELTREYETSLNSADTSNIVLGAMNIRSFVYGPWQHYANGPLNIITNPALSSAVNAGSVYTQKRVFDSTDPWALMYTTYYNGKVLYEDINGRGGFENNTSMTFENLSEKRSFNMDMEEAVVDSMSDSGVSFEQIEQSSQLCVRASDHTTSTLDGWVFEDHRWNSAHDLVHDVTGELYTAQVQARVIRDGFYPVEPAGTSVSASRGSVSSGGEKVSWSASYLTSGTHTGARVEEYSWEDRVSAYYSKKLSPGINPPRGSLDSWSVNNANVRLTDVDVVDVEVRPSFNHMGNDHLLGVKREDGYLYREDHAFDWDVKYDISYTIEAKWRADYTYDYTYKWKTLEGYHNISGNWVPVYDHHRNSSSGSDSDTFSTTDHVTMSHQEVEAERLSILYKQLPSFEQYSGLEDYEDAILREFHDTTFNLDGVNVTDTCCSDAADKYAALYVDIQEIERMHWLYPDDHYLLPEYVECDVPSWVNKVVADDILLMMDTIDSNDPHVNASLLQEPGKDPTDLQYTAARQLLDEMDEDLYVNKSQYVKDGDLYTNSHGARYIARKEAYAYLIQDIEEKNGNLRSDLNSYLLDKLQESGVDFPGVDLPALTRIDSGSLSLFNNPAMQMAGAALGSEMGIIEPMTITAMPQSKYNWTENMTVMVDQWPDHLYHDPEFDLRGEYELKDPKGMTIYPLGVRNTCVFTTGIGKDIAEVLSQTTDPIKSHTTRMVSQNIAQLNAEVVAMEQNLSEQAVSLDTSALDSQIDGLTRTYSNQMKQRIPEKIAEQVSDDPVVSDWMDADTAEAVTSGYLDGLSNTQIINQSADDTLSDELSVRVRARIVSDNPALTGPGMDAVLNRVDTDVRIGVTEGISVVIIDNSEAIDNGFEAVNSELQVMMDDAQLYYTEKTARKVEKRLQKTMKYVPCGLPLIPPQWVVTVNVWTYDVIGKYERFEVTDSDNEVIFNSYMGHVGQEHVREDERVRHPVKVNPDGSPIILGDNKPITFQFGGYATTIVGSGPKGVGDKTGGRSEYSISYNSLSNEYRG